MTNSFVLKGDIVYSRTPSELAVTADGFLVNVDGISQGVFSQLPTQYTHLEQRDHTGRLIIPGLVDLHTHAPQYSYRGTGMDLELLDWLQTYTYPEEARYSDLAYAQQSYPTYVAALAAGATTRVAIFSTVHVPATLLLMDLLENSGLVSFVGKVNMDRNAPEELREASAAASLASTRDWLAQVAERGYSRTQPILTPRFIPSCSDELMAGLGEIQKSGTEGTERDTLGPAPGVPKNGTLWDRPQVSRPAPLLCVQSHLSENLQEIEWVRELRPDAQGYADAYLRDGLLGGETCPTIMAHCVHNTSEETALLKQQGVWVAHCAESNTNLASGIAPVRNYMDQGLRVGLGTDVAGGSSLSVAQAMVKSIQASKLRWRYVDDRLAPLTLAEAFYLATRGGGSFWGQVGSFESGFEFDAVVLDCGAIQGAPQGERHDKAQGTPQAPQHGTRDALLTLSIAERLEQLIYSNADLYVTEKYVRGTLI